MYLKEEINNTVKTVDNLRVIVIDNIKYETEFTRD